LEFIRDLAVVMVIAGGVGWLCQRVGLSLIVGYLVAGAIIGPFTPPFQLVANVERVQMLSQLGLVFLIFSIGLDLSFQRIQRLGFPVVLATFVSAILVFHSCRLVGLALGWTSTQSLFAAGMLMVSSSAIISKVLQELNATHQRAGQLALGVTVLEDVVAVVMLTLLSTLVQLGDRPSPPIVSTLGSLSAFIVTLLLVSLLIVPRLLLRLTRTGGAEVRTLLVSGLLLSLAWLAARAGYSLALGAFLLGVIVASTPQKPEIERVFEGIRDMFGAVFFVAMGMLVDFHLLAEAWPLMLGLTAVALLIRPLAAAAGLTLAGHSTGDSVRAGLALTPLGEFSFIIAQMGVAAGAVPKTFYPMAVGASLLTTLLAPLLMRRSDDISARIDRGLPLVVREWISFYHSWLKNLGRQQARSTLWRLTGSRVAQTVIQIFFASALLYVAAPAYQYLVRLVGKDWLFYNGLLILFGSVFGVVLLAPLVAIWRNVAALAGIFAKFATAGAPRRRVLQPLLETALKAVALVLVAEWLLALLPFGQTLFWASVAVLAILGLLVAIFWRRLARWHSQMENELEVQFATALGSTGSANLAQLLQERQSSWELQVEEFVVPDYSACAGRRISELILRQRFGCSIASIDRQGFVISNPSAEVVLFPRDKLLLLGTTIQIAAAARELGTMRVQGDGQEIEELSLEVVVLPDDSPKAGKTLADLNLLQQVGVQIAGIQRVHQRTLMPNGMDRLEAGDELLVLGTVQRIQSFREWLMPPSAGREKGDATPSD